MAKRKVFCLNPISKLGLNLFSDNYQIVDSIEEAEIALVRSASMLDMKFPDNLKAIARAGAGVNNIPIDICTKLGIVVFNTPGANANAVKELVLCSLFLGSRGICEGIDWCKQNASDQNIALAAEKAKKQFSGSEVIGKTLGIIGLGAIGAEVANAALKLGMNVVGYDPYISVSAAHSLSSKVSLVENLEEMYAISDYITIHVPAIKSTIGMINEKAISQMKNSCVILNFSRDTLVDNNAMAQALQSKKIAKYITDFANPDVMKMENAIVLPHLGASTKEAEDNCAIMAVNQLIDFIEVGSINNSINFPQCKAARPSSQIQRLCILHENIPNMLSQITSVAGSVDANIASMSNGSKGSFAYTMLDFDKNSAKIPYQEIKQIQGVLRVRIIN